MTFYINSAERNAAARIKNTLGLLISEKIGAYTHIVVLCIGTDRVTGDSLGPFVGDKLIKEKEIDVVGTIHEPVHAKNLADALRHIKSSGKPLIIAVDAALGNRIGHITIADEGLRPGTALSKELPEAGNIGITGIVNFEGLSGIKILQNTRLSTVIDMSEVIAEGIKGAISELDRKEKIAM